MRVEGATVPDGGWPYDFQAVVPAGPTIGAQSGAGHYDTGQAVDVSATVIAGDGSPLAGARVTATLTKPDGSTEDTPLTDNGGGAYGGSFTDASACGFYQLTVTASGMDIGTPFSRIDRAVVTVGVPGDRVGDPCNADDDGDGLTDVQEVDTYHTDPLNADTDGDGYTDSQEVALGKDPLTYCGIMRADINGDGAVNGLDLRSMALVFTETVPPAPARVDQNGDNVVNGLDLRSLALEFTKSITACP